jgi:hypothetical protein
MTTETSDTNQILSKTNDAISEIAELMSAVEERNVNTVPYEGSWTSPQLLRHLTRSMIGMNRAMQASGKPADRDPGERIEQLRGIFLDFSKTFNRPDFTAPEVRDYQKEQAVEEFKRAFDKLSESARHANLNELVDLPPLGPITKLEILHFVLYHTQRHLHQMRKICGALKNK